MPQTVFVVVLALALIDPVSAMDCDVELTGWSDSSPRNPPGGMTTIGWLNQDATVCTTWHLYFDSSGRRERIDYFDGAMQLISYQISQYADGRSSRYERATFHRLYLADGSLLFASANGKSYDADGNEIEKCGLWELMQIYMPDRLLARTLECASTP